MAHPLRDRVLEALWPEDMSTRANVFVILDAARDQRIFGAVDGTYQDKCCLYSGDLPWQLQMAAPYLVQLDKDDRFTNYLIDTGWGHSWGVFFRSETSMRNLRHHLRGFLRVKDEAGRRLIFRYYDPRVLRVYLPTCTREELRALFGPIEHFAMEGDAPETLLDFSVNAAGLVVKRAGL